MIIYIKNYKGGVGKSTITKNIAHGMSLIGKKTLIVTFDDQNDSYRMLKGDYWTGTLGFKSYVKTGKEDFLRMRDNLFYCPLETDVFGYRLKNKIIEYLNNLREKFDIVIIDGAPSKNNILDKIGVDISDKIVTPMIMDSLSFQGVLKFIESGDSNNIDIIVPSLFSNSVVNSAFYDDIKKSLCGTNIKLTEPIKRVVIEEMLTHKGKTIFETNSKKILEVRKVYVEIMEILLND